MELPKFDLRKLSNKVKNILIYDEDVINERWTICQACPELTDANRCKECGCFMAFKIRVSNAKCPVGKWDKYVA